MIRHDMPPELEQVILVALAKAPEQRFGNAQAMSMALQHATAGLPAEAWAPVMTGGRPGGTPTPQWPSQAASWAGGSRPPVQSGERPLAHQTTVSAGQVTKTPTAKGGAKKGLWIAVLALVLIGGGITAAVVAGSGGGSGSDSTTAASDPTEPPESAAPVTATGAPSPSAPAPVAPVEPPKAAGNPATPTAAGGGTAVAKAPTPATPTTPTPPSAPPKVEADDDDDDEDMAAITKAIADDEPKPAAGWFKRHDVSSPARDYKKFDVDKHIAWAIAEAKRTVPDAQLFRIDMENVYPSGFADLTLPGFAYKYGGIDLRFISPSHSKRDPKIPRGVSVEIMCSFRIDGGPDGFEIRDLGGDCDEVIMPPPKCKLSQVWKKALAKHPDMADAVASIDYRAMGKRPTWWFTIYGDEHESLVSEQYPDDCQ
jgi:hypothetical protein